MKKHLLGVDIGGSKMAFLAREVDTGAAVYADKVKTPATEGVEAILGLLDAEIDAMPGGPRALSALGIAIPGAVDLKGRVLQAGNLEGWKDVPLRAMLEERYGIPVFVERDSNCGALGERWCGAATDMDSFVFLALGTGIGAGLFLDGRLYRGAHFASGEAGDLTFFPGEDKRKNLSDVVGKQAIKKRVVEATGKKLHAADALARARTKPRYERATRPVIEHLAAAVVAISALLDPEAIIFGGGTSEAGVALLSRLREEIREHLEKPPPLMRAKLRAEAQLYGAFWGAMQVMKSARSPSPRAAPAPSHPNAAGAPFGR